jgi:hypothetical protein
MGSVFGEWILQELQLSFLLRKITTVTNSACDRVHGGNNAKRKVRAREKRRKVLIKGIPQKI